MSALVALVLLASPVVIAPLGFSVASEAGEVRVVSVEPDGPAARAGLTPGTVLEKLMAPTWMWAPGPLSTLPPDQLARALTPPADEPLVLVVLGDRGRRVYVVHQTVSTAARFDHVLTPDEQRALTTRQLARYHAELPALLNQRRAVNATTRPALVLEGSAIARVAGDLLDVQGGGWTSKWVSWAGTLSYSCPGSPMRRIELTTSTPAPRLLATSSDPSLQGATVKVELPLWPTSEVREACRRQQRTLPSPPLRATLHCEGAAPIPVDLATSLWVECGGPPGPTPQHFRVLRRVTQVAPLVGEPGRVDLEVSFDTVPAPTSVAVLETNAEGALLKRHLTVRPGPGRQPRTVTLTVDTSAPRVLHLVPELTFEDGAVDRGFAETLELETKAARDTVLQKLREDHDRLKVVLERLSAWRPDFCAVPEDAVRWLQQQPEVSLARLHQSGHSLSIVVGDLPFSVVCHGR